ncbi:MAG: hypothetical protein K5989_07100 [Lachnospiraceae bacterium]|nr:hypothetical protein [Lachnospiraceae bacterium]
MDNEKGMGMSLDLDKTVALQGRSTQGSSEASGQQNGTGAQNEIFFEAPQDAPSNAGARPNMNQGWMQFDPQTGRPMEAQGNGAPMQQGPNQPVGAQFDPRTGLFIEPTGNNPPRGGQAPYAAGGQQPSGVQFDPQTGRPMGNGGNVPPTQGGGFPPSGYANSPMQPVPPAPKKGSKKVLIGVIAAVAVLAVIAIILFASGIFSSKHKEVLTALDNTVKSSKLLTDIGESSKIFSNGKSTVTLDVNGSASGMAVNAHLDAALDVDSKQQSLTGSVGVGGIEAKFDGYLDEEQILFRMPILSDKTIRYSFTEKKTGALANAQNLDKFDSLGRGYFEFCRKSMEFNDKARDILMKNFEKHELVKVEDATFAPQGQDVSCKGYSMKVTGVEAKEIVKEIGGLYTDLIKDFVDAGIVAQNDPSSYLEDMESKAEKLEDTDFTIYLYDKRLAAIKVKSDSVDSEVRFRYDAVGAGDAGDGKTVYICSVDDGKTSEFGIFQVDGSEEKSLAYAKYNYGEGSEKTLNVGENDSVTVKLDVGFEPDKMSISCTDTGTPDLSLFSIQVTNEADIKAMDSKYALDIGNATQSEIQSFFGAILPYVNMGQ